MPSSHRAQLEGLVPRMLCPGPAVTAQAFLPARSSPRGLAHCAGHVTGDSQKALWLGDRVHPSPMGPGPKTRHYMLCRCSSHSSQIDKRISDLG